MRLRENQNTQKALEIRLEQEGNTFLVILAGMTINYQCRGGFCEPTGENEYIAHENETYTSETFTDLTTATERYNFYNAQYISGYESKSK